MLGTLAFFADAPLLLLATKPVLLLASLVTATVVVVATFLAAAVVIATRGLLCRDDAWVVCLVPALIALHGFTLPCLLTVAAILVIVAACLLLCLFTALDLLALVPDTLGALSFLLCLLAGVPLFFVTTYLLLAAGLLALLLLTPGLLPCVYLLARMPAIVACLSCLTILRRLLPRLCAPLIIAFLGLPAALLVLGTWSFLPA